MATRVSWEIEHGVPLPDDQEALHRCDWPPCVNPAHLFAGSQSVNILDAVTKGRHVPPRGARNGRSKLTDEQTAEIRRLRTAGVSGKELAQRFGVSPAAVSMIHRGHRWTVA